jgi:YegS/Rv2252/BmrU family lipid kinase
MPQHKVKIIVNPNADLGRAWRTAADFRPIVEEFGGADWSGTVYPTHAVELARQAGEAGYELVVAAGGDGTAHEVVNGLMQVPAERRPRFGIVPLGTGNDFAFSVGMDHQPHLAMRQVLNGHPQHLDIGVLHDDHGRTEYWDNTMGIGFDATVTIRSRNFTYLRGFILYLAAVLQTIALNHDAPRMEVHTDREEWAEEQLLLTLCNGEREGGGFLIAPGARNNDGVFDYASIRRVSRLMMLRLLPEVMKGTHGKFKPVRIGQFKSLKVVSSASMVIHTDGEIFAGFGTDVRHLTVEMLPGALEVVA